jgi:hypothetical protein
MPVTIQKPPHGAPCNSCGLCCEMQICPLGVRVFAPDMFLAGHRGADGPCPAIEPQEDGRKICGLMASPAKYAWKRAAAMGTEALSKAAAHLLGAGTGCDAPGNDEPVNEAYRKQMFEEAGRHPNVTKKALKTWGIMTR